MSTDISELEEKEIETISFRHWVAGRSEWSGIDIIDSTKAYEVYDNPQGFSPYITILNTVYAIHNSTANSALSTLEEILDKLKSVAFAKKLEGHAVGGGSVIVQSRTPITVSVLGNGEYIARWRGEITRLPTGYKQRKE